jgi:hypothetical protein
MTIFPASAALNKAEDALSFLGKRLDPKLPPQDCSRIRRKIAADEIPDSVLH